MQGRTFLSEALALGLGGIGPKTRASIIPHGGMVLGMMGQVIS